MTTCRKGVWLAITFVLGAVFVPHAGARVTQTEPAVPTLEVTDYVTGLRIPWGLAFTPDGTLLFTQRAGRISARLPEGTTRQLAADLDDLFVGVESGLLDLELDTGFATNRRFYTCQAYTVDGTNPTDIRVVAWTVDDAYSTATRSGPVLTGIPITTGQHSGCRLISRPDNTLFVTSGDAVSGSAPQDLGSLAGKVLRVDETTGQGVAGNPFISSSDSNTRRIWTYGHRNPQGLAFRPGTNQLWEAEHGTSIDDELNRITKSRNYGWDPVPAYNGQSPMTDREKFPNAELPRWRSRGTTPATSGITWLTGSAWGPWEGAMAVACLQGQQLLVFQFAANGRFQSTEVGLTGYGRLRSVEVGPDGALYVSTSNGPNDRILRVAPARAA